MLSCYNQFRRKHSNSFLNRLAKGIEKSAKDNTDKEIKENVQLFSEKLSELDQDPSLKMARESFAQSKKELLEENKALLQDIKEGKRVIKKGYNSSKKAINKVVLPLYDKLPKIDTTYIEKGVDSITKGIHTAEESLLGSAMDRYGGFRKRPSPPSSIIEEKVIKENNTVTGLVSTKQTKKISFPVFKVNENLRRKWEESDNVFIFLLRRSLERVSDFFSSILLQETDQAKCIREIKKRIPSWKEEEFTTFLAGYVFPSLLEALIVGDLGTLRSFLSDAPFAQLKSALSSTVKAASSRPDGRILDMRNVELITGNLSNNANPTLVYTFQTQQTSFITVTDADGTVRTEGDPNRIENYFYVVALSLTDLPSPLMRGWKIVEFAMRER